MATTKITKNNNTTCDRYDTCKPCGKPNAKSGMDLWVSPRCNNCINKCYYVDMNGNTCNDIIELDTYCRRHYETEQQIKQHEAWELTKKFHSKYIPCGSRWEECDDDGPIPIYLYISREKLGSRSVHELEEWEYDEEIWFGDARWKYCGREGKIDNLYPEDFIETLQIKALIKN